MQGQRQVHQLHLRQALLDHSAGLLLGTLPLHDAGLYSGTLRPNKPRTGTYWSTVDCYKCRHLAGWWSERVLFLPGQCGYEAYNVDAGNKQKEIKRKLSPEQVDDIKFATIYSYT